MKKFIVPLLIILFTVQSYAQEYKQWMTSTEVKISVTIEAAEAWLAVNPDNRKERKAFERWKYNALRQQDENGYLRKSDDVINALRGFMQEKKALSTQERATTSNWEEQGPTSWNATEGYTPGVGRITSYAKHPTNTNLLIVGSETGGVWTTSNLGTSWTQLTDNALSMKVYALAIDPTTPTTYYWGSNEGKIYKSIDSGATWSLLTTLEYGGTVNKILIHPTNSSKMYATAQGSGIYQSNDAGATWVEPVTDFSGFDVEFKPSDPNTIYITGQGFHYSTNGGVNWTTVSGFTSEPKMIGVSANNSSRVYVLEADGSAFNALYKSDNSGTSFTKLTHTQNFFGYESDGSDMGQGQAPRDMGIAVNPNNADEIHIAGINTWRSTNGGTAFSATSDWSYSGSSSYCHADVDDIDFMGSTFVALTDGGIYFATNSTATPSASFYTDKSTGMGIHQFYKIGVSQTSTPVVTGGAQDNGSSTLTGGAWKNWVGADGMEGFVDKNNTNLIYGTQQEGALFKSTDGGVTNVELTLPEPKGNWVTPFEQDPTTSNTIYSGYKKVYKSTDQGDSWTPISQDFGANLDNLKIAPSNSNIMFASKGSTLYKTTTGSGTWSSNGFSGNVNSIAIHPTDPNKVAVASSASGKVYISADGGTTWNSSNTGLPAYSALCVVWQNNDKNGLYVGMDYGVFYIEDGMSSWVNFATQLPNVQVNELDINAVEGKLYAATYGRGVWKSDLYSIVLPIQLGDFYAKVVDENIKLSWYTLSEVENDYFIVQKSLDGIDWYDLEKVESKGNSNSRTDYSIEDKAPYIGVNYYRLVNVSRDGEQQFSRAISANMTGVDLISIFPNPSDGRFLIYTEAKTKSDIEILIYNSTGQLIKATQEKANEGVNKLALDLDVDAGIYFLTMKVDGVAVYQGKRLVVEK